MRVRRVSRAGVIGAEFAFFCGRKGEREMRCVDYGANCAEIWFPVELCLFFRVKVICAFVNSKSDSSN